jgi:hypothetical protein
MSFPAFARPGEGRARSRHEAAALIHALDRATALRVAADLRRLGGRPCPRDPRRYEFPSPRDRDRAMAAAREGHGWTCVEPDDAHATTPR